MLMRFFLSLPVSLVLITGIRTRSTYIRETRHIVLACLGRFGLGSWLGRGRGGIHFANYRWGRRADMGIVVHACNLKKTK